MARRRRDAENWYRRRDANAKLSRDFRTIYLFGNGAEGQLGNGGTTNSPTPFLVPAMNDVAAAALGSYHTCVITRAGAMRCWGMNASGQIGNGMSGTGVRSLMPESPHW